MLTAFNLSLSHAIDEGKPFSLSLVVYHLPLNFKPTVMPHGNSKSETPFYPTWPSTMKGLKQELQTSGPKQVMSSISTKAGGVLGAMGPGQLPQNEMQISNAK